MARRADHRLCRSLPRTALRELLRWPIRWTKFRALGWCGGLIRTAGREAPSIPGLNGRSGRIPALPGIPINPLFSIEAQLPKRCPGKEKGKRMPLTN